MTGEGIAVNWGLRSMGFDPGEVERRRFLDRHHHLLVPLFYSPDARLARDRQMMVERWQAMERAAVLYREYRGGLPSFWDGHATAAPLTPAMLRTLVQD
jgi:hypothetical protein